MLQGADTHDPRRRTHVLPSGGAIVSGKSWDILAPIIESHNTRRMEYAGDRPEAWLSSRGFPWHPSQRSKRLRHTKNGTL